MNDAGSWFVQAYTTDGDVGPELPCADFAEVLSKIMDFRGLHSGQNLMVHVPHFATDAERHQLRDLDALLI
jgi:hypothetical protein